MAAAVWTSLLVLSAIAVASGEWSKPETTADRKISTLSEDWIPVASAQIPVLQPPPAYQPSIQSAYIQQTLSAQQREIQSLLPELVQKTLLNTQPQFANQQPQQVQQNLVNQVIQQPHQQVPQQIPQHAVQRPIQQLQPALHQQQIDQRIPHLLPPILQQQQVQQNSPQFLQPQQLGQHPPQLLQPVAPPQQQLHREPQLLQPVLPQQEVEQPEPVLQPAIQTQQAQRVPQQLRKFQRSRRPTTTTSTTTPAPEPQEEVQLLYVPVETLRQQQQASYLKQQQILKPTSTEQPITTPEPYQPPLSVFMSPRLGHNVKINDVIKVLKESKSISVLDAVGPESPQIFVGPSNLQTPDGYAKFELPYLSALESNRVERKVDKLPFFVAPLSFKPPPGYSKIPFPAPHVGSVVVSNVTEVKKTYSLPAELPPISPELPSLVNSLLLGSQKQLLQAVQQVGVETETTLRPNKRTRHRFHTTPPTKQISLDEATSVPITQTRYNIPSEDISSSNLQYHATATDVPVRQTNYRVPSEDISSSNQQYHATATDVPVRQTNYRAPSEEISPIGQVHRSPPTALPVRHRISAEDISSNNQQYNSATTALPARQTNYRTVPQEDSLNNQQYHPPATTAPTRQTNYRTVTQDISLISQQHNVPATDLPVIDTNYRAPSAVVSHNEQQFNIPATEVPVKQTKLRLSPEDDSLYQQQFQSPATIPPVQTLTFNQGIHEQDQYTVQNAPVSRPHPDQQGFQGSAAEIPVKQTKYVIPSEDVSHRQHEYQIPATEVPVKQPNYRLPSGEVSHIQQEYQVPATEIPSTLFQQQDHEVSATEVPIKKTRYRKPSGEIRQRQQQYEVPVTETPVQQLKYSIPPANVISNQQEYQVSETESPVKENNYRVPSRDVLQDGQQFQVSVTVPPTQTNYRLPSQDASGYQTVPTETSIKQLTYKSTPEENFPSHQTQYKAGGDEEYTQYSPSQRNIPVPVSQENPINQLNPVIQQQQHILQQQHEVQQTEIQLPHRQSNYRQPALEAPSRQQYDSVPAVSPTPNTVIPVSQTNYNIQSFDAPLYPQSPEPSEPQQIDTTTSTTTTLKTTPSRRNRGRNRYSSFSTTTSIPRTRNPSYSRTRRPSSRSTTETPHHVPSFESSRDQSHRFESRGRPRSRSRTTASTTTITTPTSQYVYQDEAYTPASSIEHSRLDTLSIQTTPEPVYHTQTPYQGDSHIPNPNSAASTISDVQYSNIQRGTPSVNHFSTVQQSPIPDIQYSGIQRGSVSENQYPTAQQNNLQINSEPDIQYSGLPRGTVSPNQYSTIQRSNLHTSTESDIQYNGAQQELLPVNQYSTLQRSSPHTSTESDIQLTSVQRGTLPENQYSPVQVSNLQANTEPSTHYSDIQRVSPDTNALYSNVSPEPQKPAVPRVNPQAVQDSEVITGGDKPAFVRIRGRVRGRKQSTTTTTTVLPEVRKHTNFLNRGSARRTQAPTTPPTTPPTVETTTPPNNKVYTVRPVRRPQPVRTKLTTKGRIRRPTTTTPVPQVNDVAEGYTTEIIPTTRRFQNAEYDAVQQYHPKYQSIQRQPGLQPEQQYISGGPQYLPEQGYQQTQQLSVDRQKIQPDQQRYQTSQVYQQAQPIQQKYQIPQDYQHYVSAPQQKLQYEPSDQEFETTNHKYQVIQRQRTSAVDETDEDDDSQYGSESQWSTKSLPFYSRNAIPNINKTQSLELTTTPPEVATTEETSVLTTLSTTTKVTKPGHGRRRGSWVRVKVRPQQTTDIFETAESQNIATVAAANMLSFDSSEKFTSKKMKEGFFIQTTPSTLAAETYNDKESFVYTDAEGDELDTKASYSQESTEDVGSIGTTASPFENNVSTYLPSNEIEEDSEIEVTTKSSHSEVTTQISLTTFSPSGYKEEPSTETPIPQEKENEHLKSEVTTITPENTELPHFETTTILFNVATSGNQINSSMSLNKSHENEDEVTTINPEENKTSEPQSLFGSLFPSLGYEPKSEKEQSWSGYDSWWGNTHTNHRPYYSDQQLSSSAEEKKSFALNSNIWDMDSFTEKHSVKKANPERDITTTVASESITVTEQPDVPTTSEPVTSESVTTTLSDINIKRTDTKSMMARILGTTTSTRVSHETEICYRGRCIKTKTKDSDIDQMSIE